MGIYLFVVDNVYVMTLCVSSYTESRPAVSSGMFRRRSYLTLTLLFSPLATLPRVLFASGRMRAGRHAYRHVGGVRDSRIGHALHRGAHVVAYHAPRLVSINEL
jgi:hypothetical protein